MIRLKDIRVLEDSNLVLAILFQSDLSKSNGADDRFGLQNVYDVSSGRDRRRRMLNKSKISSKSSPRSVREQNEV